MGTSNWQNISHCISVIRNINPQKILDIGVGFGRWGILCREFLDVWQGRVNTSVWEIEITGVEIFKPNISEYHKHFYNEIYFQDASDFIKNTDNKYDLIIMGDVLEHFPKDTALELLKNCIQKSEYVMLNIPIGNYWFQGEAYGNPNEKHLSFWKISELKKLDPVSVKIFRDEIFRKFAVVVFSKSAKKISEYLTIKEKIKLLISQYPRLKSLIKKY